MRIPLWPPAVDVESFVLRFHLALAIGPTQRAPVTSQHTSTMRGPTLGTSISNTWQSFGYKPTFLALIGSFNNVSEPP